MKEDPNICKLRDVHSEIVKHVGLVQDRTMRLVREQERDMLTAFRARLLDVQNELEKEKEKKDDGAAAWIERSRQLEVEVDKEKERADKLDRINQALGGENGRLKLQFETQEDDRAFLLRQLVAVKADNQKMRDAIKAKQLELAERQNGDAESGAPEGGVLSGDGPNVASGASLPAVAGAAPGGDSRENSRPNSRGGPGRRDADGTYRDMIRKLSKMLDMERKHIAQVQSAHAKWRENRTPLEVSLRDAVAVEAHGVQLRVAPGARGAPRPAGAAHALACVEINHWNALSSKNFKPL
jgi:hypothetical protein